MKRQTEQLKENLILAGVEHISQFGIDKLSLRSIAKDCGVTHGSPYKHFGSKDGYLQVLLQRLSSQWAQDMMVSVVDEESAVDSLTKMGVNFIHSARDKPFVFEALFVKFPFNYMTLTDQSIESNISLPGFEAFKAVTLRLHQEYGFPSPSTDTLIHFWSFISGFALMATSPIGENLNQHQIEATISSMLDIYIKGETK